MKSIKNEMTKRKNVAKIILIVFVFAMFFIVLNSKSFAATAETLDSVLFDGTNYVIYTSNYKTAFEYAFGNDLNNPPTVYYQCSQDKQKNNVVIVPKANIVTAKYLYIKGDSKVYEVNYAGAFDSARADYLLSLTRIIAVDPTGKQDVKDPADANKTISQNYVKVTDTNYTELQYILIKLDATTAKSLLGCLTDLNDSVASSNPVGAILAMKQFDVMYKNLSSTAWVAVPSNKIIEEPLDTQEGDVYVLWLKEKSATTGNTETDMQILTSKRLETQGEPSKVLKLPKTGADFTLEGLLAVNVILIGVVLVRIRSLKKKI